MELTGSYIRLERLSEAHHDELLLAATADRSSFGWAPVPSSADEVAALIASRRQLWEQGTWYTFATRRLSDGQVVGSTSFLNVERWSWPHATGNPDSVEIGSTWLMPSAQRTPINSEAKYLMMVQAFEEWGVKRLQIKTDARNERSRNAILRLGAVFEGILRNYQPGAGEQGLGTIRSTAMYSIVDTEWPEVRDRLVASLYPNR
jgi:N-acetyltransferase